jgi:hypothetical protein
MSSVLRKTFGVTPKTSRIRFWWRSTCASNSAREKRNESEWWLVSPISSHAPVSTSSFSVSTTSGAHWSSCSSAVPVIEYEQRKRRSCRFTRSSILRVAGR